jgi:uncharacterized damage-inducible protein DinB
MDTLTQVLRLFQHNAWANLETLESLKKSENPPSRPLKVMAHIIGAEDLWLVRLRKTGEKVVVWPEITVNQCEKRLKELSGKWTQYLNDLNSDKLINQISYTNSKGEPWTNTIEDILLHVVMHSSYHRGQIAIDLRTFGLVPAYTDFIHSVRQGFVESAGTKTS